MILSPLVHLELRVLFRQRLTWIVLVALLAAMIIGAAVGSARVASQKSDLQAVALQERQAVASAKATAATYGHPADYEVAQFRDPTDAYGYMFNFLTAFATRPPKPLAALAAGQSDLQPAFIRVNFANVFPDSAYELKSPRMLSLGAFDLGFVLVYLLPLAVIALGGSRLAMEQDSGILRMMASQPLPASRVAGAKFSALALILVPFCAVAPIFALAITGGVGSGFEPLELGMTAVLVGLYTMLWVALCALAVSQWKGMVGSLTLLVLAWASLTVVLPSIASLALDIALPPPSRLAYIDASRSAADHVSADKGSALRWLSSRRENAGPALAASSEVARLSLQEGLRDTLQPRRQEIDDHAERVERSGNFLRLMSPALVIEEGLQRIAGTDAGSHRGLAAQGDAYTQTLRRWFEPQILHNVGMSPACRDCPGRLNFSAYDAVPRFVPPPAAPTSGYIAFAALYLAATTLAAGWLARRRFREWPV